MSNVCNVVFLGYSSNPVNYNNSNGGPANMATVSQMPINTVSAPPQALPVNNGQMNGHNFPQNMNMLPPQQDFGNGRCFVSVGGALISNDAN